MNKSKIKGTAFETRLLDKLRTVFPNVERRAQQGALDKGDFANVDPFVIEAKNHKSITLAEFMDETEAERKRANVEFGACIINRRHHELGKAYVVMPLDQWLHLVNVARCPTLYGPLWTTQRVALVEQLTEEAARGSAVA